MPGLEPSPAVQPTPWRRTVVDVNVPDTCVQRPPFSLFRRADEMAVRRPHNLPASDWCALIPGVAIILANLEGDLSNLLHTGYNDAILTPSQVTTGGTIVSAGAYRAPTDIGGIGAAGDIAPAHNFRRAMQTGASQLPDAAQSADQAAFFPVPTPGNLFPMDRIAWSNNVYPPNTAFGLTFSLSRDFYGTDAAYTLYEGGPSGTLQQTNDAGFWALTLYGSGKARLWERGSASQWVRRKTFQYSDPLRAGATEHHVIFQPIGKQHIAIGGNNVDHVQEALAWFVLISRRPGTGHVSVFRDMEPVTGHDHYASITGQGFLRLDQRRNIRSPFSLWRAKYPVAGVVKDWPFVVEVPPPAGTPIFVRPDTYLVSSSLLGATPTLPSVTVAMYDARDDTALTVNGDGSFQATDSSSYYCVFTLNASADQWQTPVLYGYRVDINGSIVARNPTPVTIQPSKRGGAPVMSVTGPDTDPTQETARLTFSDRANTVHMLAERDRIPCRARVIDRRTGATLFNLFRGETRKPRGAPRRRARKAGLQQAGAADLQGGSTWVEYDDLTLVGQWARAAQVSINRVLSFAQDPNDTQDPKRPWRITEILQQVLFESGFTPDQVGFTPGPNDMRLWPSPSLTADDYVLQPGTDLQPLLQRLVHDYLGRVLCWDDNRRATSGSIQGQWVLLTNPSLKPDDDPGAPLWYFHMDRPGGGTRKAAHSLLTYGSDGRHAPIIADTFHAWTEAPEFNYIEVTAVGYFDPSDNTGQKIQAVDWNADSWDKDPSPAPPTSKPFLPDGRANPDYLGFFKPAYIVDPSLPTKEAANLVCRRAIDFAGHGRNWCAWRAPLLHADDGDPLRFGLHRPPRINDRFALVRGNQMRKGIIHCCNPDYERDSKQEAEYEALLLTGWVPLA